MCLIDSGYMSNVLSSPGFCLFFLSSPCEHAARKPTHGHLALTSAFLEFFFFLVCVYSL